MAEIFHTVSPREKRSYVQVLAGMFQLLTGVSGLEKEIFLVQSGQWELGSKKEGLSGDIHRQTPNKNSERVAII